MPAKNINLLPQKDFDQTPLGRFLRWSLTYGRYIIVCTEIVVLLAFIYRFSLDRQITDLNEEVDQKVAIIKANLPFERQFRNLQHRTQEIGTLLVDNDLSYKLIKHLESITPRGIIYKDFGFDQNKVTISATAVTDASLALFLHQLKNSQLLTDIDITSLSKRSTGVSEITFQVGATIKQTLPETEPEIIYE